MLYRQSILSRRNNDGVITILDLKLYYKAIINTTSWHMQKIRHVVQQKRRESGYKLLCTDTYVLMKTSKTCRRKASFFNKYCQGNQISAWRIRLDARLSPCIDKNAYKKKDFKEEPKALALLREGTRRHRCRWELCEKRSDSLINLPENLQNL